MIEFLMANWGEVVFGLLIIAFLLMIIFANMCYQELRRKCEEEQRAKELTKKEKRELQNMLPKLPKEEKNDRKK